jgi:hypothetical protein
MEAPFSINVKTYTNKQGEVIRKEYNQTEYYKKHYSSNKEKYTNKIDCGCGCQYTLPNKHNHKNTRIHKLFEKYQNITSE